MDKKLPALFEQRKALARLRTHLRAEVRHRHVESPWMVLLRLCVRRMLPELHPYARWNCSTVCDSCCA
ncbi:hypothetical protein FJP68_13865 [Pantoea vagans]|uniref:Uncharacterized protein n=1 Tax=Pantoea eucalypti TaxID=470933 RepID=A0ABY2ZM03_9GAMM|nr:hypothetical protein FJP68_13865 [Pantoea vagans]TPV39438.1 hypothetical protein FJW02_05850 [Pantoea eucalypti]